MNHWSLPYFLHFQAWRIWFTFKSIQRFHLWWNNHLMLWKKMWDSRSSITSEKYWGDKRDQLLEFMHTAGCQIREEWQLMRKMVVWENIQINWIVATMIGINRAHRYSALIRCSRDVHVTKNLYQCIQALLL